MSNDLTPQVEIDDSDLDNVVGGLGLTVGIGNLLHGGLELELPLGHHGHHGHHHGHHGHHGHHHG